MRVVVQSNIPHYHYLASALEKSQRLERYFTSVALHEHQAIPSFLPAKAKALLESRRVYEVSAERITSIRFAEIAQRLMPRLRLVSRDRADAINNDWFDAAACRQLPACDVLHFTSSVGLHSARKARARGSFLICDVRQEHPFFQRAILEEEGARWKVPVLQIVGASYEERVLEEFALADHLIVPSEHARRTFLAQGFAAERVSVIPYGVSGGAFQSSPSTDSGAAAPATGEATAAGSDRRPPGAPLRLLYAGAINLRKGVLYLLQAMQQLDPSRFQLTLAGPIDSAMPPLMEPYRDHFRYVGSCTKQQLGELYRTSDLFVLPSLADSFSLATFEAMSVGLPVVLSHNTGAAELITEGVHGHVLPIRSPEAIAKTLTELAAHPERLAAMGCAAKERAARQTWGGYEACVNAFYDRLAAGSLPPKQEASLQRLRPELAASRQGASANV